MTIFDDIFAGSTGVAATLLGIFGTTCVITYKDGTTTYDPLNGGVTPGAAVSDTVDCSPPFPFGIHEIDGTVIERTDLKTIIRQDQLTAEPPVGATATIGGVEYRIVAVMPIQSGDEKAAYTLALRQ